MKEPQPQDMIHAKFSSSENFAGDSVASAVMNDFDAHWENEQHTFDVLQQPGKRDGLPAMPL